ncbi:phage GP46 family protein [Burkholderia cenocepacia]|uniref:phage GP46 family protein n=1 Tax=Burkholderia cepacia complex TaxID=87882 RepID=UPI0020A04405|nr:phage GP46 family protein [Burkholderia cenocepacia]MCO8324282.1 phage GP46 family protein [Burkholderia cenocepacia]MCO8333213.1 phage GP46 family protein [Burkholderia cenocepacia]MCO8338852.1 phage GP46 family protein [Burkholderia cenocepacia]MCO8346138.1 phage GP46 family protein [Burkholderia cenocepacia]MCO8361198.1 phage GP46 family protein [Burkholderia cenocepacia]
MIDILTTARASADTGIPFDWSVIAAGRVNGAAWHDFTNPCAAPAHFIEVLEVRALEMDDSLCTAVILSLFSDRRADADTILPHNQTDRRGWCGDEFVNASTDAPRDVTDQWGSHLWLCYVTKSTVDVLERARFAAYESLQWMLRTEIASRLEVDASWTGENADRLALRPRIWQSDSTRPVYDVLWGTTLRKTS